MIGPHRNCYKTVKCLLAHNLSISTCLHTPQAPKAVKIGTEQACSCALDNTEASRGREEAAMGRP